MRAKENTIVLWDYACEVYRCGKCRAILYYNFDFKKCPYCERQIERRKPYDGRRDILRSIRRMERELKEYDYYMRRYKDAEHKANQAG